MTSLRDRSRIGEHDRSDPFMVRLHRLTTLTGAEITALTERLDEPRRLRGRAEIVGAGRASDRLHVLLDGWACRYSLLPDGRRQIAMLFVPGDICDLDSLYLRQADSAVATLTPCTVASIGGAATRELAQHRPAIGQALGWLGAVENAMLAERTASLGRRSAREQVSHLLCELLVRLSVVGLATDNGYMLPITQEEIADVLGLTAVHVNRVLQALRSEHLIEQQGHALTLQWQPLRHVAGFRSHFLHLEGMDGTGHDVLPAARAPAARDAPGGTEVLHG